MTADTALKALEQCLYETLKNRPRQLAWGDLPRMQASLAAVRARFGGRSSLTRAQRIAQSLMAFRLQGKKAQFLTLKYACAGLTQPMAGDSRVLLEDEALLQTLLQAIDALRPDPRRFQACRQALRDACQQAMREAGIQGCHPQYRNLQRLQRFLQMI
ncbi:MAG: hypothetical protein LBO00_07950 [Zoogloeaceae bacterium]|jgi:hypothetical protein|nr:hypothetical protein [Zoogloeaceae bacterium]